VTPSVTPSVTPTSSFTPSVTPTSSVTPSITPTPTPTPSSTPCCYTWYIQDNGAHRIYTWTDCDGISQSYTSPGGPSDTTYACSCNSPTANGSGAYTITNISNGCNIP
jgi:hypothetical protein